MNSIQTLVKKFPFSTYHPSEPNSRLVRTLVVSDTLYVPEGMRVPTNKELGWLDVNGNNMREVIRQELIRSKTDGLPADLVDEVTLYINESIIDFVPPTVERVRANWHSRFGIRVTMPGEPNTEYWFEHNADNPLRQHTTSEWSGIGDPNFYLSCAWVSDVVAAGKAKEILDRWQSMGFKDKPVSTEVRELCYGRQQIQLVTEMQRDALHDSKCAFTPYRSAETV